MSTVEVILSPAELAAFERRDLSATTCVVFDVLRATTSMLTALANGAACVVPVSDIAAAVEYRRRDPTVLLAGERNGLRITASQSGGVEFDLGNSPREFTSERVRGRMAVMTTTNGTRALRACLTAKATLLGGFVNLRALAKWLKREKPAHLALVCSGTGGDVALEDVLAAGALLGALKWRPDAGPDSDAAALASAVYRAACSELSGTVARARNARRLLAIPELRDDVALCLARDSINIVAALARDGVVRKLA
jgi:2-phosphosulfolactate phosphatase